MDSSNWLMVVSRRSTPSASRTATPAPTPARTPSATPAPQPYVRVKTEPLDVKPDITPSPSRQPIPANTRGPSRTRTPSLTPIRRRSSATPTPKPSSLSLTKRNKGKGKRALGNMDPPRVDWRRALERNGTPGPSRAGGGGDGRARSETITPFREGTADSSREVSGASSLSASPAPSNLSRSSSRSYTRASSLLSSASTHYADRDPGYQTARRVPSDIPRAAAAAASPLPLFTLPDGLGRGIDEAVSAVKQVAAKGREEETVVTVLRRLYAEDMVAAVAAASANAEREARRRTPAIAREGTVHLDEEGDIDFVELDPDADADDEDKEELSLETVRNVFRSLEVATRVVLFAALKPNYGVAKLKKGQDARLVWWGEKRGLLAATAADNSYGATKDEGHLALRYARHVAWKDAVPGVVEGVRGVGGKAGEMTVQELYEKLKALGDTLIDVLWE